MHPQEISLLMGWPMDLPLGSDLRAVLCLLDNLASPLQSLWVFSHLGQVLHEDWQINDTLDPSALLRQYKEHLLFLRFHL